MREIKKGSKSFVSIILLLILIGGSIMPVHGEEKQHKIYSFSGGDGSSSSPYLLSTVEDLLDLSEASYNGNYMGASYKLTEDIDLGQTPWIPIANEMPSFEGIFNGNGKKITIRRIGDTNYMGLFKNTSKKSYY